MLVTQSYLAHAIDKLSQRIDQIAAQLIQMEKSNTARFEQMQQSMTVRFKALDKQFDGMMDKHMDMLK